MRKSFLTEFLVLISLFLLSGCTVRTYKVTKERVDQDLSVGNRGYLIGKRTEADVERPKTRPIQVIEIEGPPIQLESTPKRKTEESAGPTEYSEDQGAGGSSDSLKKSIVLEDSESATSEKYTVKKGDTLQKISLRFYGTTKKWNKIYEANQGTLKGPNKIYPGQVINIPLLPLKEAEENLK